MGRAHIWEGGGAPLTTGALRAVTGMHARRAACGVARTVTCWQTLLARNPGGCARAHACTVRKASSCMSHLHRPAGAGHA
jgi:hypothetical protein